VRSQPEEWQVTTYIVRNEADALQALDAMSTWNASGIPSVRFEGWPRVAVTVPEGLGLRSTHAVRHIEKIVQRQFCLLKYGTTDLRRLTTGDKAQIEPQVAFPHPQQVVIDLSRAANAAARVVKNRSEQGEDGEAFGATSKPNGSEREGRWRTARETALALVRKLTPAQAGMAAMSAIIVAGLAYSCTTLYKTHVDHQLALQKEANAHQLRLAELEQTTVVAKRGNAIAPAVARVVEREMDANTKRIKALVSAHYEGPFYGFIKAADHARPALLELAGDTTININGLTMNAQAARAAAKAMRRAPDRGWDAVVRPAKAIESLATMPGPGAAARQPSCGPQPRRSTWITV
jgi:hypothetical protein